MGLTTFRGLLNAVSFFYLKYPSDSTLGARQTKNPLIKAEISLFVAQVRLNWNPIIKELNEWAIFRKQLETADVYS
ncbi:MAG TPA: hypothetical protein DEA43_01930 [Candidatus Moranbacteria bacterium]|nr:hypothetical protein [Candidatus Moranbacteria bacterium]HBT45627.1 hypothetical protein [Candidatus Moranbacteria bacterium]